MQSRIRQEMKNMGIDPNNKKQMMSLSPQQRARLNAMSNRYGRQQNKFMFDLGIRNRQQPLRRLTLQQQQQLKQRQQVAMMKAQLKQQKNISPQRRAEMEAFLKASTPTRVPQAKPTPRVPQAKPTPRVPTPSPMPTGVNRRKAIQDAQIQYRDMLKKQMEQRNKRKKQNEQRVKAAKMTGGPNPNVARQMEQLNKKFKQDKDMFNKVTEAKKKRPTGTPRVPQAKPTPKAPTPRRRRFRFRGRT